MKAIVDIAEGRVTQVVADDVRTALPAGQAYLRLVEVKPEIDAATHRLQLIGDEIAGAKVVRRWGAIPLTSEQIWQGHLDAGYVDALTGIKLKTTEYAQAKFSQAEIWLKSALEQGALTPASQQTIFDFDDVERTLSVAELRGLLLRYGFHCVQIFNNYAP